ncbi:EamA family transporter RarD [soil metagenome]
MSSTRSLGKADEHQRSALIAGLAAFLAWGLVPVYWKMMRAVPASEILAHRFVWTTLFLVLLLSWQRRWPEVLATMRSRRATLYCVATGLAISVNWLLFIWAVNANRILETSLGYFINPLVNVLLGAIFLHERLTRLQFASVMLATVGVLNLSLGYGEFPWVALVLAGSFGIYGLLRKLSGTAAIPGMFLETTMLLPIAVVYLLFLERGGDLFFGADHAWISVLLISTGVITGLPLVWFGHAARHLQLTTVGFMQYIAPSCTFFLGVFLYNEPFTRAHLITFTLIWVALAIFTADALWRWRSARQAVAPTGTIGPVPESTIPRAARERI